MQAARVQPGAMAWLLYALCTVHVRNDVSVKLHFHLQNAGISNRVNQLTLLTPRVLNGTSG